MWLKPYKLVFVLSSKHTGICQYVCFRQTSNYAYERKCFQYILVISKIFKKTILKDFFNRKQVYFYVQDELHIGENSSISQDWGAFMSQP